VRRGTAALTGSPVLVGAVTVLVTIVGVFLAYNANAGLPFLPTYDLTVKVPNAASLVNGSEVRIGGSRVGAISDIEAVPTRGGGAQAELTLRLTPDVEPLPVDSTFVVRPRSSIALKYLAVTPGDSKEGFQSGAVVPVTRARPEAVELDEVLNIFDARTREGARASLAGFGDGFAGRGQSLNVAIEELVPLLSRLEPVARNLSDPGTGLGRLFRELGDAAAEAAPVAEEQAQLFVGLDVTFSALAQVARPFIQETISRTPPTFDVAIQQFPLQRPFLRNSAALFRELRPGVAVLPTTAPALAGAFEAGARTLPGVPATGSRLASLFERLEEFSDSPGARGGIRRLTATVSTLRPTVAFLTPVQTVCNYASILFRNASSLFSEGTANGTWERFQQVAPPPAPNDEGGPSQLPANGPTALNHLHANIYPNTASPGQPRECEAGNEPYLNGRTVIGNVPGNQGATTETTTRGGG
jgi:ABC-type transporter Mla subunit MlaD